jgi:CubicO group peptidase (beta-lactamase class C family)
MRSISLAFSLGLALHASVAAQSLPRADAESVGMSSERLERIDAAMQRYVDDGMIAGGVALVARDGKVVHLSAQGHRWKESGDPMDPNDIFVIMSMTKPIVSAALMMLFEEGHFLLDDPIVRWIPELEGKQVVVAARDDSEGSAQRIPAARPITFRHVLTHTAGVDPDRELLSEAEQALLARRSTLEETLVARAPLPLAFHPGDRWNYGSSTDYVALLVERISGQRLDRFLQERIFDPLGMVDTHYNVPASKTDRVAAVYAPSGPERRIELRFAPGDREVTTYFGGVAGLSSTAADYFRFSQMILNGGELDGVRILSPTTVNLMITNHVGDLPITVRGSDGYGFGLSFSMVTDAGTSRDALTPGAFGWLGAWNTVFWIDPTERTVMILLTQLTSSGHINLRRDFPGLVMQAITESRHSGPGAIRAYGVIER